MLTSNGILRTLDLVRVAGEPSKSSNKRVGGAEFSLFIVISFLWRLTDEITAGEDSTAERTVRPRLAGDLPVSERVVGRRDAPSFSCGSEKMGRGESKSLVRLMDDAAGRGWLVTKVDVGARRLIAVAPMTPDDFGFDGSGSV